MIQGSSHPRTARSALGQDTCGRRPFPSLIFFPRSCRCSANAWVWEGFRLSRLCGGLRGASSRMTDMIPTEREGATHQLPMPSDGRVASDLILRPAQGVFDVFVA